MSSGPAGSVIVLRDLREETHFGWREIGEDREVLDRIFEDLNTIRALKLVGRKKGSSSLQMRNLVVASPVELVHDARQTVDFPAARERQVSTAAMVP